MEDEDQLRKKIAALEKRAEGLEKRYDRIVGKFGEFVPKTTAIMREGIPLEVFSRLTLLECEFDVFGSYCYNYLNSARETVERSVDIYAVRDAVYVFPPDAGKLAGQSRSERHHILVEAKQRRAGVEWIFADLPSSVQNWSPAGNERPNVNVGFEIRPNESGLSTGTNPKDVNNAIAQLNQAYMPFQIDLHMRRQIERPGMARQYASASGNDYTWLLLITNAKLRYFIKPSKLCDMDLNEKSEELFREVPWVVFHPEPSIALRYHQEESVRRQVPETPASHRGVSLDSDSLAALAKSPHEVHVVNYDHLRTFLALVDNPPRISSINPSISVDGKAPLNFSVKS